MSSVRALQAQTEAPKPPEETTANSGDDDGDDGEEVDALPIVYGVKGGLNVGWLRNDDATMDERVGPLVGLFAALQPRGPIGIQLEMLYASKGYKSDGRSIAIDCLEVPLLVSLKLPRLGRVRPSVLTGPAAALRLRTRYGSARSSTQTAFREDVNRFHIGWVVGAALDLPLSYGALIVEGRYNLGLSSVFVDGSPYAYGDDRHRAYVGLIGYRF